MEFLTIKPKIWYRWAWIFKMNLETSSEQKLKNWKMQQQRNIWMDLERRRVHHHLIGIIAIQDWVTTTFPSLFKSNWAQQLVKIKDSSLKVSQDPKMMQKPFSHTKRKSKKKSTQQQKKVLKSNLNMKKSSTKRLSHNMQLPSKQMMHLWSQEQKSYLQPKPRELTTTMLEWSDVSKNIEQEMSKTAVQPSKTSSLKQSAIQMFS